jgi:hypothetical protein
MTAISSDSDDSEDNDTEKNGSSAAPSNQNASHSTKDLLESNSQPVSDEEDNQEHTVTKATKKSKVYKSKSKANASPKEGEEVPPTEDGEINELEEGELESETESDDSEIAVIKGSTGLSPPQPPSFPPQLAGFDASRPPPPMPIFAPASAIPMHPQQRYIPLKASERSPEVGVCKFYLRAACTWGEGCKFFHPPESVGPFDLKKPYFIGTW